MVARVDPTKCKLYPEEVPEAIVTTASASGVSIASYGAFAPYTMAMRKVWTGQIPGVTLRMDNDSGHGVFESPLESRPKLLSADVDIISHDSLDLWAVGAALESYYAYTVRVSKLNIFEKIKYSVTLTDAEKALADEFGINNKYLAGILGIGGAPQFKQIYEVAKKVTVAAGGNTRVGRIINVKKGEKAVLLGVAVDRDAIAVGGGGPGANDTYFTLNRDITDAAHIQLDCLAMPPLDYEMPCYIPAINRHEILIESTTGVTNLPVRYRYGVANLTLLEKIRWGISMTSEETKLATDLDLFDSIQAGIL